MAKLSYYQRRGLWDDQSGFVGDLLLAGRHQARFYHALRRAYLGGRISRPLAELTSDELLSIRGVGPVGLRTITAGLSRKAQAGTFRNFS